MLSQNYAYRTLNISASDFKQKALVWANNFRLAAFYQNNQIDFPYHGFEEFLAVSNSTETLVPTVNAFENLQRAIQNNKTLLCGFLSYDLKNQIEKLESRHPDSIGFPLLYFFQPDLYIHFLIDGIEIFTHAGTQEIIEQILTTEVKKSPAQKIQMNQRVSKENYLKTVRALQNHILEGDVYEINYCHEFYSENAFLHPAETFWALNAASPMPFAGFFKLDDKFLICASPERSLKKEKDKLISQPIKGTIKRSPDKLLDEQLRQKLQHSEKEISENMMIMDLVRNDLSKSARVGSVQVEEMFGIYGYQHLYQMITTVTALVKPNFPAADCLKNAFPMGSMTGAPKIRAMQLIEDYEVTRRGLFSGSLGYLKPNGDFDFNVIIRSLQYNASSGYLSFMVGSAITYDSDPEQEYAECFLKAEAILNILEK
jgi:para-aminobenzoate synthetase component I